MSRLVCNRCQYSQQTCVCDAINIINNNLKIIILQHPSEVKASKNTAHLVKLTLTNCEIHIGEHDDDFTFLNNLPSESTAVLYPGEDAILLDNKKVDTSLPSTPLLKQLIVIDGTWKKAFKIMQLTKSLQRFNRVSFDKLPKNRYVIRKAPRADSLSTLEAVAYSLQLLEQAPVTPLYNVLNKFIEKQTQFMPEHVKARYFDC